MGHQKKESATHKLLNSLPRYQTVKQLIVNNMLQNTDEQLDAKKPLKKHIFTKIYHQERHENQKSKCEKPPKSNCSEEITGRTSRTLTTPP